MAAQESGGPSDQQLEQAVPAQKGSRDVSVGLFVLIAAGTFILLLYMLTDPATFRGRYKITTAVEDVTGLRNGDPVQMRGVNIGRVHRFGIERGADSVLITLEVEGEWEVPSDSRVDLVSGGVLAGGRIVKVVPGTSGSSVPVGGHIPGAVVRGILEDTDELGARGMELLDRINGLVSDSTVASVQGSLSELETLIGEFADLAESQGDDLGALVTSLREAADGLAEATGPEVRESLSGTIARADSMMVNMNSATERLHTISASLETILGRMERGEGTLGQLSVNDDLYDALTTTVTNLNELIVDFRANPGKFINFSLF